MTAGGGVLPESDSGHIAIRPPASPHAAPGDSIIASDARNVHWLHENSGLTWDQLGRLFGVSRRTVHLWANGSRMNAQNTETVARVVRVVRGIGARTPDERQAALLAQDGGASVFEGLAASRRGGREPINAPAFRAIDSLDLVPGDGVAEI